MSSLKDLAQSLGLSITTVSRALDGYSDVAKSTRERVVAAAAAAGYRPNAAARRLRKGSTEVVTLVLPTEPGQFNEPLYIELLAALGKRLARDGYDLTLLAAPPGSDELKAYHRIVEGHRADGLIVVRTRRSDQRIDYLLSVGFPFVAMGRSDVNVPYAFVDGDGEAAFRDATRRLIALGHRHILHLAAPDAFNFAGLRRIGYQSAMEEAGLPCLIDEVSVNEDRRIRRGAALARRAGPPHRRTMRHGSHRVRRDACRAPDWPFRSGRPLGRRARQPARLG